MTYETWDYHATIAITNPSATADVQASFTFDKLAGMNADYSDCRFATTDGVTLSYWIEEYDESSATIWVKLPADDDSIILYWGNSEAVSESSGDDVFEFFDDFEYTDAPTLHGWINESGSAQTSDTYSVTGARSLKLISADMDRLYRNITGDITIECNYYDTSASAADQQILAFDTIFNLGVGTNGFSTSDDKYVIWDNNTYSLTNITRSIGWHTVKCSTLSNVSNLWFDNNHLITDKSDSITKIYLYTTNGTQPTLNNLYIDTIKVYKSVDTQPTLTLTFPYTEWTNHSRIQITKPSSTDGVQVKLDLPKQAAMNADFSDIRFTTLDGLPLSYWIESSAEASASVWIKLPANDTEIFIYYGNSGAVNESSGDDTFEFFDDFVSTENWDISSLADTLGTFTINNGIGILTKTGGSGSYCAVSKQSFSNNICIRAKIDFGSNSNDGQFGLTSVDGENAPPYHIFQPNYTTIGVMNARTWFNSGQTTNLGTVSSTYHIYELKRNANINRIFLVDDILVATHSSIVDTEIGYISFNRKSQNNVPLYIDWVLVRKYVATEPTLEFESLQSSLLIDIINPSATDGVQVKFELPLQTGMNSDFSDIRFERLTGEALPYWIESSAEASASVWIRLPANDSQIQIVWGASEAVSESSGDDTFEFFDDFSTDTSSNYTAQEGAVKSYDSVNKYLKQTNTSLVNKFIVCNTLIDLDAYIFDSKIIVLSDPSGRNHAGTICDWSTASLTGYRLTHLDDYVMISNYNNGSATHPDVFLSGTEVYADNRWLTQSVYRNRVTGLLTYQQEYNDIVRIITCTDTSHTTGSIGLHSYGNIAAIDEIRVRKYVDLQPELILYPTSYPYSIILDVVNPSTTDGVQVKFELPLQTAMEADFSQLYFSKTDDITSSGRIPYWIEATDVASATIWVKLPADTYSIRLSWGQDVPIAAPSGDDTFEVYETFSNASFTDTFRVMGSTNVTKSIGTAAIEGYSAQLYVGNVNVRGGIESLDSYTMGDGKILEYMWKTNNAGTVGYPADMHGIFVADNGMLPSTISAGCGQGKNQNKTYFGSRDYSPILASITVIQADTWYRVRLYEYPDGGRFVISTLDGTVLNDVTGPITYARTSGRISFSVEGNTQTGCAHTSWISDIKVMKYVAVQPEIVLRTNYRELFSHRATITVTDPSSTEDVQAMFELPLLRDMAADYADIRFSTTEGRALSYWIEASDESSANVWVKLPADDSQIYIYWGNSEAVTESSGYDTFEQFDDFVDTSAWSADSGKSKAVISSNLAYTGSTSVIIPTGTGMPTLIRSDISSNGATVYEVMLYTPNSTVNYQSVMLINDNAGIFGIIGCSALASTSKFVTRTSSTFTVSNIPVVSGWHKLTILDTLTTYDLYVDDEFIRSVPHTSIISQKIAIGDWWADNNSQTVYFDTFKSRKYVTTQPTLTLSTGYLQTDLNQHTIAVQYPSAVADVQTLFTFLRRDGMNRDYSDLRFAGWGSENRPYWIESADAASAAVWISLPADDTFIYYYWGDDTAVAASSGADTFDAFVADDLTDWDVYTATDCTVSIVNDALEFYVPAAAGAYAYIKSKDAMTGEFVIESVAAFSHQDVNAETFSSIGLGFPYFIDGNGVVIRDYSSGDIKIAVEQKTGETTTAGDIALIGDASTENQRYYLTSKDDSYVGYLTDTGTLDRLVETDNKVILGITTDSTAVPAHDSHVYTQFAFVRKYVEIQPILTQGEFSDGDNLALWGRSVDILLDVETVVDNQQVLVTLPFLKNMADDFSDIRFANEALEQMPHWIDSKEDLVEAKVWVNVPTSGSTSLKCLYKMADAEDGSDGPRTFDVFDHFEGTTLDSDVWYTHEGTPVVADSIVNLPLTRIKTFEEWDLGYAVHAMVRRVPDIDDSIGFNNLVGASRESITTASGSFFMARNSNTIDYVKTVDTELAEDTNWHIRDVAASPSGSIRLSVDNNLLYTETDPTYVYASGSIPVTLYGGQVDWFSIRKAVDVEPVATVDVDALYSTWAYSDIITFDIPTIVENQLCSVVITARDGMNSDFSDLRFATRQGTELRYAMEPPEYTSSAKFWLEIQSIGTTEVIAFWGKADAEDESQWDDLFPIMHEFFEEGIDAEKWPTATGAIVTDGPDQTYTIGDSKNLVSLPITTSAHQIEFEIKWTSYSSNGPRLIVCFGDTKHYVEIYANGTGPSAWHDVWLGTRAGAELSRVERAWSLNKWYTFKIVSTPTLQKVIISNNNVSLTGAHASTVEYTGTIIFDSWDNNALRIKDIKVRPYIAQDPVLSFPDSIGAADDILTDFVAPITGLETQIESFLAGLPYESSNSSSDTRTREIPALFESILGSISTIDGNTSYLETFLDAVWSQPLASADETRERTTPTLVMSNIGGSGIPDILVEYAYDVFVSSTRLKTIGAALRTTVRNRPGNSTRMDVPFNSMELGEPYETIPLELDGLMRTGVDDSYIEGFKLPIIAHVNRISGAIFPNSVVILEGVSNKVLTQTDYRGIIIDWIPFDEYNNAIFVSANNIVYTQLSKEEVELYVFNYIINRASIANAPFRMVHSRLG